MGPIKPSEFPAYDALTITFDGGDKKQDYDFLLSKDRKTLIRLTKLDLSKDPYAEVMKKINVSGRPPGEKGCQSRGGQFRRLPVSVLLPHAPDSVSAIAQGIW